MSSISSSLKDLKQPLSDKPTEKKVKEKKPMNPDIKRLIDSYNNKFLAQFGVKPVINGGQAGMLFGKLLALYDYEKILGLLVKFFDSGDKFIKDSGYTIGAFYSQVNKLIIGEQGQKQEGRRILTLDE